VKAIATSVAFTFVLVGCSKKLSKEAALDLLTRGAGPPTLECVAIVGQLDYDGAGVQFAKNDVSRSSGPVVPGTAPAPDVGCAKKLEEDGFLTGVTCGKTKTVRFAGQNLEVDMCTAALAKGAHIGGSGNTKWVVFPCGTAHGVIQSVRTEGRHATIQYSVGIEQTIEGGCAALEEVPHGGEVTASLDDDGHWILDRAAH
jgi:hypothetical protein